MTHTPLPAVTLGESMGLIRADTIGSLAQVSDLQLSFGGAESNVAIGLARLGVPVRWLGRVGADSIGRRIVRELRAENVGVNAIEDNSAPSGLMLKERPSAGTTAVNYYRAGSSGSRLQPSDLAALDIPSAGLLHVTGITLAISDTARDTVHAAIDLAVQVGVPVSFDVNHRSRLWTRVESAAVAYREVIQRATIVFAGEDEAALVVGEGSAESLAEKLARLGPREVIVKRGAEGCVAWVDGVMVTRQAIGVDVIDTVGAGDAFVAGYLAEKLLGSPLSTRLTTAVIAGAAACTQPGDWEGAVFRRELAGYGIGDPVRR